MSSLDDYLPTTDHRLLVKWAHYYEVYERQLAAFRGRPVRFLEIGIYKGGSIPLWKSFLGAGSGLTFVDIDPECAQLAEPGIAIEIGNQADSAFMAEVARRHGPFDIVIDDGSHVSAHQIASFGALWPHIADGGLYIVEDTHCSYWPGFGGGYRNEASFIEFSKRLVDRMHSWYTDQDALFPFDPIARELDSVRFYDSIVMLEKRLKPEPPTLLAIRDGRAEPSRRALQVRGRTSIFAGKDGRGNG